MRLRTLALGVGVVALTGSLLQGQARKPASPPGTAATQVGGKYVPGKSGQVYQGGKWIEVTYGRPIKRGRENLFGSGADYGKALNDGSPVWRAGANQTTRLMTEVPLIFDGKTSRRGIQRLRRPEGKRLDADLFHLAGTAEVRSERQDRALGILRLHPRQGRAARRDESRNAAVLDGPVHHRVYRHDGRGRQAGHDVGQNDGVGTVQGR